MGAGQDAGQQVGGVAGNGGAKRLELVRRSIDDRLRRQSTALMAAHPVGEDQQLGVAALQDAYPVLLIFTPADVCEAGGFPIWHDGSPRHQRIHAANDATPSTKCRSSRQDAASYMLPFSA